MDFELIGKYLAGEASEEETQQVFEWADESQENYRTLVRCKKAWALSAHGRENSETAWNYLFERRFKKEKLRHLAIRVMQYAAVILLVFGTGIALQRYVISPSYKTAAFPSDTRIDVPMGQMANVRLPDGTVVMLNSGSSLVYNGNFSRGQRNVMLEGEAYFEVTENKEHPFTVQTSSLSYTVYGTKFNLEAFPDDGKSNAVLIEGSLGVWSENGHEIARLVPGEKLCFDREQKKYVIKQVNTDIYTSWREGLITFRNEKIKQIAKKIERWYNVEIIILRPEFGEESYFGTIMKNKPVDQILEVLKLTSSLKYEMVPRPDKPTLIYWK